MSAPFLFELGFTKLECAQISKFFGISLMVTGGLLGGIVIHSLGLNQTIILCAFAQTLSCLMFVIQGWSGHDMLMLTLTIGIESLCSGLASTTFIAYLSHFCKGKFNISHFTLLYSIGSFSRVLISTLAGWIADISSWTFLFFLTSISFLPVIYFLLKIRRQQKESQKKFLSIPLSKVHVS
jgi:PAT family beta-lactamase induction signal transducer AmpG